MKLNKRIQQAIDYNVKEIIINEENYNNLDAETKSILKQNKVKITLDAEQKDFLCKFK